MIDLKSETVYEKSHLQIALSIPTSELTENNLTLKIKEKNIKLTVYCDNNFSPYSSSRALTTKAIQMLNQLGYENVY